MIPVSILPASLHVHAIALEWKHRMYVPNYYCLNEVNQTRWPEVIEGVRFLLS